MSIINKLIPFLEIDLGGKKLYFSSQDMKIRDENTFKQYDGKLKSEGGITRSFSIADFKTSQSFSSNVSIINNTDRLQDVFSTYPDAFSSIRLGYLGGGETNDMTNAFEDIIGIASNPNWDNKSFTMTIKDTQKLYFKNVPIVIFDEKSFQQSYILSDATLGTKPFIVGDPSVPTIGGTPGTTKQVTLVQNIVSSTFAGKPLNFWKGTRVDVIMDVRASDDTNNASGQFAVVVSSFDTTVFFNNVLDRFLANDDQTATTVLNNTMMSDTGSYDPGLVTLQAIRNAMPQNSDSVGSPVPIIYGSPERVPMVWAIGQKSTVTNSFGVGDDIYLISQHRCKLGVIPDSSAAANISTGDGNNVIRYTNIDLEEIKDGLRVEVWWSLEDKRVVDAKIAPSNRNWISNPFPKRLRGGDDSANAWRDKPIRLVSPFHRVKLMKTLRGEIVQAVQLRGGEFDWYDLSTPLEQRGQFPVRYGMGNSKLYISTEGIQDDQDGFYTGFTSEYIENEQRTVLVKNPADVMLHFLMNFTSINENRDLIDIHSFRTSRMMLRNWRFDTAINEIIDGQQLVDRWSLQCCSLIFVKNNKFKMKTVIPSLMKPTAFFREGEHIFEQQFQFTDSESIYNNFIFSYRYDYANKKYAGILKRNISNDQACRNSFAINGFERAKGNIELRDIADEFTANAVADILVDLFSKRRVYLNCKLIYNQEVVDSQVEIGDCVSISSSLAPNVWNEKLCVVLETKKVTDHVELKLMEL